MSLLSKLPKSPSAALRVAQTNLLARPVTRTYTATAALRSPGPNAHAQQATTLLQDKDSGLGFIRSNPVAPKPRSRGVTEMRGPYYSAYGKRHLQDVMETVGAHVDGLKFAGGSFSLMPEGSVKEMIDIAHENGVYVSTVSGSDVAGFSFWEQEEVGSAI